MKDIIVFTFFGAGSSTLTDGNGVSASSTTSLFSDRLRFFDNFVILTPFTVSTNA